MKKNISINISGIIFHIEEDGYEKLKNYLDSISGYFSSFDDSGEIIADIESRIAEIFLSKLNEGKQVITIEDVDSLVATMGSIRDFQAVEEDTVTSPETETRSSDEKKRKEEKTDKKYVTTSKKLYRDDKRKLIGGVCAGIAHYFAIDPLWIRLLFILLGSDIFFSHSLGILVIIAYIVLWIVLPASTSLEEDHKMKKMYRDPDDRVLGGVASGVAAYFGTDVTLIRVLFVISIFIGFGTGLLVYVILWIILPEATGVTDKVQMKGEPVTLKNIESNIKKRLKVDDEEEESTLVKILLFPFRLIAVVLTGLARALGPILLFFVQAARILVGLLLVIVGISCMFVFLVTIGVLLGIFTSGGGIVGIYDFPIELFSETVPIWGVVAAFVAGIIPVLVITLLGLSLIAKTNIINVALGWILFGLWMISLVGLSFAIPKVVYSFRAEANYEEIETYNIVAESIHLNVNETDGDEFDLTELSIKGYEGTELKLVKTFSSFGSSRKDALQNAQSVGYKIDVEDSIITFDSNIHFESGVKFRFQELDMTLYIPYGQQFTMSDDMRHLLKYYSIERHGYYFSQMENNIWIFNPSGLECLTCYDEINKGKERSESYRKSYEESFRVRGYYEEFDFSDYDEVVVNGAFEVRFIQSEEYRLILNGQKNDISKIILHVDDHQLSIKHDRDLINYKRYQNRIKIIIGLPALKSLELRGAIKAFAKGFDEERVKIILKGASEADIDMDAYEIDIDLAGASRLTITGSGHEMTARLSAASMLDAYDFRVDDARIDASVASSAKVYVTKNLDIHASIISDVKYRGGAKVRTNR
ncbi:MAG: PspC domain-containing protein [Bacteroidetes bacterium]|nr:PspC domain-containing protein [Bacteroidota bacterium]